MSSHPALYRASEILREEEDRHRAWLHDNVLQVLEYVATGGYGECRDPERLMQVAARAADDVRIAIDGELDVVRHHDDFRIAMQDVVEEARDLAGDVDIRLDLDEVFEPVDPELSDEIVAVTREALTNARKHAHARVVMVQAVARDGAVEVRVVDDGDGFDPLSVREGVGFRCSMRQRMARVGGSVAIASAPGRGAVVRIMAGTAAASATESVA